VHQLDARRRDFRPQPQQRRRLVGGQLDEPDVLDDVADREGGPPGGRADVADPVGGRESAEDEAALLPFQDGDGGAAGLLGAPPEDGQHGQGEGQLAPFLRGEVLRVRLLQAGRRGDQ
jgi:hypothetical protein